MIFLAIITGRELSKIDRPISRRNDRRTSLLSTGRSSFSIDRAPLWTDPAPAWSRTEPAPPMNHRSSTDANRGPPPSGWAPPPPPRTDPASAGSTARSAPLGAGLLSLETIESRSVEDPSTVVIVWLGFWSEIVEDLEKKLVRCSFLSDKQVQTWGWGWLYSAELTVSCK